MNWIKNHLIVLISIIILLIPGCFEPVEVPEADAPPTDGSDSGIVLDGSHQNPAWSPDGVQMVFTLYQNGYDDSPADLYILDTDTDTVRLLTGDDFWNVNWIGSAWNDTTNRIVFSSTQDDHDDVFSISDSGSTGDEFQLTNRASLAINPSFSSNGDYIVFESYTSDSDPHGAIVKVDVDGDKIFKTLTDTAFDCRKPNWALVGDLILYQKYESKQWDIWVMDTDGINDRKVTSDSGNKIDGSWSPDGKHIVYASDEGDLDYPNIFTISVEGGELGANTDD